MVVRAAASAFLIAAIVFCCGAFDAANAIERALQIASQRDLTRGGPERAALLGHAAQSLDSAVSAPLTWNGDALEARSWIAAIGAPNENDTRALGESARFAALSVRASPLAPASWLRLAALDRLGVGNPVCNRDTCLARSWRAAPAARFELACARIREAHAENLLSENDIRLHWLARTGFDDRARLMACVDFVRPETLFALLAERPTWRAP